MKELKVESIFALLKEERTDEVLMVVRNAEGKYLLVRKHYYPPNVYRLPAGGVEGDETVEDALSREVIEEFNVEMDVVENLGTFTVKLIDKGEKRIFSSHAFLLESKQPLDVENDDEHEEHLWIDKEEFPGYIKRLKECEEWPHWGRFRALAMGFAHKKI